MGRSVPEEAERRLQSERIDLQVEPRKSLVVVYVEFGVDGGVGEGGCEHEDVTATVAADVGEVVQDADDVGVVEMLHHHPRHHQVVVRDIEWLRDHVHGQELPRTVPVHVSLVTEIGTTRNIF